MINNNNMTDNITLLQKYQPQSLKDIRGHDTIRQVLISMVRQNNIPHMMFTGKFGTGKSTIAMALIKDLYGNEYKSNYVKFDASSERGIDVVRGKIKEITKYRSMNFPFKIILLEESDELTPNAQFALREIMLKNQAITRFIFVNNNINKIIEPIVDRCQLFRFPDLKMDDIANHLKLIVKNEEISITSAQISTIAGLSRGSMRAAVNTLQSCATQERITDSLIRTLLGAKFSDIDAKRILKAVYDGDQGVYESEVFKLVYKDGFTPEEIMHGLIDLLISKNDPSFLKQVVLLAEYDFRMSQGSNKLLQLRVGLSRLANMKR